MFTTEVKERKVCLDEGFKWGGEDVRMGEVPSIVSRVIKKPLLRAMPDQTECECGRLTRLKRSSKVYDLESQRASYPTYVFPSLLPLVGKTCKIAQAVGRRMIFMRHTASTRR